MRGDGRGATLADTIRKCLAGPMSSKVLADVARISTGLRAKGLNYNAQMQVVERANRGTVPHPRDTWEELLHCADRWESLE